MIPRAPKRALVLFALAFIITTAELCWWVTFNVKEAAKLSAKEQQLQQRDCALAKGLLMQTDSGGTQVPLWFARYFPDLALDGATGAVRPKPQLLEEQARRTRAHVRMFIWEGSFFFGMVLLGAAIIMRTIRQEVGMVRQQGNFLNAVTHELKSPLAAMRLYIETLERRTVDPQTLARYVATLRAECDRLDVLVSHVLTLARLERRGPKGPHTPVPSHPALNVDDMVAKVVQQLIQAKRPGSPPIEHVRALEAVAVTMEEASLRTVLRNLLDNACKYGKTGAKVVVHTRRQGDRAIFCVQDFGIGFVKEERARIFERFYRVGDEMVRRHDGSGLGLYLVRMLLADCGGRIDATSPGLGQGAMFEVSLPASPWEPS